MKVDYGNFESNINFLKSFGKLNKKMKILEIGSGKGNMVNYLKKQGYNIIGTEINQDFINESEKIFGKLPIKKISGDNLKFKNNSFDIVLSFDVFEHIADSDKHLQEVRRVLKQKGYYLLSTPNKLTNIPFEIWHRKSLTDWKSYHFSLHTYKQLKKRLIKNGFIPGFYDIMITTPFFKNKIKRFFGTFGLAFIKIFNPDKLPKNMKTNFYVVARRR